MQCFRGNNDHSPPLSPMQSSVSMDSLNKYFPKRINRKSIVRRSFEIVRKNVVRHSQHLLPQKKFKARKLNGNTLNIDNNRPSCDSLFLAQRTDQHAANTYCGGGDDFVISDDSAILTANSNNRKQFYSNAR